MSLRNHAWGVFCIAVVSLVTTALILVQVLVLATTAAFTRCPFKHTQAYFSAAMLALIFWLVDRSCPGSRMRVCVDKDDARTMHALHTGFRFGGRADRLPGEPPKRFIVMANHQLYLDWMYVWCFLSKLGLTGYVKFILKRQLMFYPIVGLGMQLMDFIFVSRNWDKDKDELVRRVKQLVYADFPYVLVVFPEGTTLSAETHAAMLQHAAAKSYPESAIPRRCLIPRVNGTHAVLNSLGAEHCEGILDLTIGFHDVDCAREDPESTFGIKKLFFHATAPRAIHFHAKFVPISEVPFADRAELSVWMKERFLEKDRLLEAFTKDRTFPHSKYQWGESGIVLHSVSLATALAVLAVAAAAVYCGRALCIAK